MTDSIDQIFFESLLKNLPYYIFWKNTDSVYLGCNKNFAELVGLQSSDEIEGLTDYDLSWGSGEADFYRQADQEVMLGVDQINQEEILIRPDGSKIVMLVSKTKVCNKVGQIIGILGISTGITKLKVVEEELKIAKQKAEVANQAKTEFIAGMSHDLRTPLQAIVMMTEVLQKRLQTPDLHKPLNTISKAGNELMQLVEAVLSFSKLESGKQELLMEKFHLHQLIEDTVELMEHSAQQKNLQLIVECSAEIPSTVVSDSAAIRRILFNLINNAIKFTEQGRVQLAVNVTKIENDTVWLQFKVSDTGIGIPSDKLESIFERFSRVESGQKKRYEGIGLGLAIVKQLVQALGGEVQVTSELSKGSEFTCLLPFELQPKVGVTIL